MPFPRLANSPYTSVSCKVGNKNARAVLLARIDRVTRTVGLSSKIPVAAASIVYLGLCRLKQVNELGDVKEALTVRNTLLTANELYVLEQGGKGINCSYFEEWEHGGRTYPGHRAAIDAAMSTFVPEIKALKKRCLLLIDLGSKHDDKTPIPEDEGWLDGYDFTEIPFE